MKGKEGFLERWSRVKRAAARAPAAAPAAVPAAPPPAELPPVEGLDFSSDFSAFLRAKVEESLKRAALKKLFHSEHFNRMDGLDVYVEDYGRFEPIPPEMLARLEQARGLLYSPQEKEGNTPSPVVEAEARVDENQPAPTGMPPTDPPTS